MKHNEIFIKSDFSSKYTSTLEEGDYIPYFVHKRSNQKITIQNSAGNPILFITLDECSKEDFNKYKTIKITTYFICKQTNYKHFSIIDNVDIFNIFPSPRFILTTPNLKIWKIYKNFKDICINTIPKLNPPIIIVPNVITESFKDELIEYYDTQERKVEIKGTKNRNHVYTDKSITEKLDDKLTKSLFPELKKIYNLDVTHRENYKICNYIDKDKGKFHPHRDSVYPYGHRRLAMSLLLNDDYEGGGLVFSEYNNIPYRSKACDAIIFPTSLYHEVLEITKGTRYVVLSFLFGDEEAKYKNKFNKDLGRVTNNYKINIKRDMRNLIIDDICSQKL